VARSLIRLYGKALKTARFASIGPLASATLRELGFEPAVEASPQTTAGLVDAILNTVLVEGRASRGGGSR
jgi:uroporphyrinogen-III synthase